MSFEEWLIKLGQELSRQLAIDGDQYISLTGLECWREMFNDGLSPAEAAYEEATA